MSESIKDQIAKLLDEYALAEQLGVSIHFLRKDRYGPRTIPFIRLGDLVRYDPISVHSALLAREQGGPRGSRRRAA